VWITTTTGWLNANVNAFRVWFELVSESGMESFLNEGGWVQQDSRRSLLKVVQIAVGWGAKEV